MGMHLPGHAGQSWDIAVVPQADFPRGFAGWMDIALLRADHRPAALRLDAAHHGHGGRMVAPHAVAMGHLVKAVARRHRADRYRLEQDIVAAGGCRGIGHFGLHWIGAGSSRFCREATTLVPIISIPPAMGIGWAGVPIFPVSGLWG